MRQRVALDEWIDRSSSVVAESLALVMEIEDSQSAIALELLAWHELMELLDHVERRVAALKGAAVVA